MRNVLVTGAASPLGKRLIEHLRSHDDVERVVGVEPPTSSDWIEGATLVSLGSDHREWVDLLQDDAIDTVIDCGLVPDRNGTRAEPVEAKVVDAMRLGAAVGHSSARVRAWVVASSSAVYPIDSHAPLLWREESDVAAAQNPVADSILEAEGYVRDVAERTPHLNVAILRLQQLCGPGVRGPLASLLANPRAASPIGFDPPLQLLAVDDAVRALAYAAEVELAGLYNVASSGVLRRSEAARLLGRSSWPVLPFEVGSFAPVARSLGLPHVPSGMLDLLRFGQAIDTSKLAAAGFHPERDQRDCLASLQS